MAVGWQVRKPVLMRHNGIKLKADRLNKQFGDGGLILACVMLVRWNVREAVLFY